MDTNPTEALEGLSALQEHAPKLREALASIILAPGVTLRPVESFALQADLIPAAFEALGSGATGKLLRIQAALVGLAWNGPNKPKAKYQGDPMEFGGAVLDELIARVTLAEITNAGGLLLMLAAAGFIKRAGVMEKAATMADFTVPPAGQ